MCHYDHNNWLAHEKSKKKGLVRSSLFADNGVEGLMAQVAALRPTAFAGPPRIWSGLRAVYSRSLQDALRRISGARDASKSEDAAACSGAGSDEALATPASLAKEASQACLETIHAMLGGRLQVVVTGGAPTSHEVHAFAQRALAPTALHESYGSTEAGGICEDGKPCPGVEVRLRPLHADGSPVSLEDWSPSSKEAQESSIPPAVADPEAPSAV